LVPLTLESLELLMWTTDCTEDGEVRKVQLDRSGQEAGMGPPMRPDGRQLYYRDDPTQLYRMLLIVDLSVVAGVDLDGSGGLALAVDTSCFLGNGFSNAVEVWDLDEEGWPVQLPPALVYSKSDGYVIDLGSDGDALIITMRVGVPGDQWPHLNGYPYVRVSAHRFDGVRWSMNVRSLLEDFEA
jgi:hypothetical protein